MNRPNTAGDRAQDRPPSRFDRARRFFAANVIAAAFAFCATSLSGIGLFAIFLFDHSSETDTWVLRTAVAIGDLERLHLTLVEAESAGRSFLVFGSVDSKSTYRSRLQRIDDQLRVLREFISDNPEQQALLPPLEQTISRRFAHLEAAMGVRETTGIDALLLAPIGGGKREMQSIASYIGQMKAIETRLLNETRAVQRQNDASLRTALVALILFGIGSLAALFWHIRQLWVARVSAEAAAVHDAHHDHLTGLPNRRLLEDRMTIALASAQRCGGMLAVLCLDLDGFKAVNDQYGHDVGDELLRQVGRRLNKLMRSEDTVARVGGDEFVVILPSIAAPSYSELVGGKIVRRLSAPYAISGHQIRVSATVGIALYPSNGLCADDLLKAADTALYRAKQQGKARCATALTAAA